MQASRKKPYRVHVQYTDGKVSYIPWTQADELFTKNKAIFISNTLFKAAKVGINIKKLKGKEREDDRVLKARIKEAQMQQVKAAKKAAAKKAEEQS